MKLIETNQLESKSLIPGFEVKFVHSDKITIAFWVIKAGSFLPKHSHFHEQVSQVTAGKFQLTVENEVYELSKGSVAVIPPNVDHSGVAITDCKIMDIFSPVREDYM